MNIYAVAGVVAGIVAGVAGASFVVPAVIDYGKIDSTRVDISEYNPIDIPTPNRPSSLDVMNMKYADIHLCDDEAVGEILKWTLEEQNSKFAVQWKRAYFDQFIQTMYDENDRTQQPNGMSALQWMIYGGSDGYSFSPKADEFFERTVIAMDEVTITDMNLETNDTQCSAYITLTDHHLGFKFGRNVDFVVNSVGGRGAKYVVIFDKIQVDW